ncbi:hypothetical protein RvY_06471 [Ramazzottius varieornatus]|uniref:G-protein coupled receptors family 1 profile domain-containing protein n=1 Tax=Ramazzottius varieornatus TaxID=947166 RepID=A0A1D1UYP9_RAMVA|nr:hypothetical protein RvY_06471 [Ramazzottius varieornatus]
MFTFSNFSNISQGVTVNQTAHYDLESDDVPCMPSLLKHLFTPIGAVAKLFAACLNLSIVFTFFKVRRLITPFTIHVVNLILIDLGSVLTLGPMLIYREYDSTFLHYTPFCALYQYFTWIVTALIVLQHTIICVDRWLALYAPIVYREKKIYHGVAATIFVIGYFHAWFLPMFVNDVSWDAAESFESGRWLRRLCDAPRPRPYLFVAITMIFWIPEFFVYCSYPLILHLIRRRRKKLTVQGGTITRSRFSTSAATAVDFSRTNGSTAGPTSRFEPSSQPHDGGRKGRSRRREEEESTNTLVLVMLGIQMSLWLPITVLIVLKGVRPEPACTTDLFGFAYVLGVTILLADPFVYLAFLPDLKREVYKLFPIMDVNRWVCRKQKVDIDRRDY